MATLTRVDQILAPIRGQTNIRNLSEAVAVRYKFSTKSANLPWIEFSSFFLSVQEVSAAEGGDKMFHPLFRSDGWKKLQGKDNAVDPAEGAASVGFMNALVVDVLKDYARLKGTSIVARIAELLATLQHDYSLKNLQTFAESI